jgi:hypothetical protein
MIKSLVGVMVLCSVAAAGPKDRYVDVTATFKRTVTDDGSSSEKSGACTTTTKSHQVLTVQVMVVQSKVKITDSSDRIDISMPMPDGKLTGQGQYTFTIDSHKTTCDGKEDLVGSSTANADAKDVQVIFYFDKKPQTGALTVSPAWGQATGQGKMTTTSKSGGGGTVDAGPLIAAQGGTIVASAGNLALDTQPMLDQLDKGAKQVHEMMTQLAQGKPLLVSTPGSAIDLQYSDTETTDLAKLQPPPGPGKTSTLVRKVTTEVSIHATPSK